VGGSPSAEQPAGRPDTRRLAVLLAWVAGGVDAIGYLALAHLFTAHMSGNTVALGASAGQGEGGEVLRRGVAISLFAVGIALGTAIGEVRRLRGGRHPTVAVFVAEMVLLAAFVVVGTQGARDSGSPPPDDWRFYVLVAFPTLAMGLQSATLRRIGELHVRTTYISGVLTSLMEAVIHQVFRLRGEPGARVGVYASVWGGYLLGATLGGLGYARAGLLALVLPIAGLGVAAALDLRHPHELATGFEPARG
jgi:uncharacterized membrane protein YoaK (UPF0700 family)